MKKLFIVIIIFLSIILLIRSGILPLPGQGEQGEVIVFVLDSEVDKRYVSGPLQRLHQDASHGDVVTWVIRNEAPEVTVRPISVSDFKGNIKIDRYLNALQVVKEYKERNPSHRVIVNVSLGFEDGQKDEEIISELTGSNVIVIAAAGNEDSSKPLYPAAHPRTIAVANAERAGKSENSNFGDYIDIAARGTVEYIERAYLPGQKLTRQIKQAGTSFSAPVVAGFAAELFYNNPSLQSEEVIEIIKESSSSIASSLYYEGKLGAGLLNKNKARERVENNLWNNEYFNFIIYTGFFLLTLITAWMKAGFAGIFIVILLSLIFLPVLLGTLPLIIDKYSGCNIRFILYFISALFIIYFAIRKILFSIIKNRDLKIKFYYYLLYYPDSKIKETAKKELLKKPERQLKNTLLPLLSTSTNKRIRGILIKVLAKMNYPPIQVIMKNCKNKEEGSLLGKELNCRDEKKDIMEALFETYYRTEDKNFNCWQELFLSLNHSFTLPYYKNMLNKYVNEDKKFLRKKLYVILEVMENYKIEDRQLLDYLQKIIIDRKEDMWLRYQSLRTLASLSVPDKKLYNLIQKLLNDKHELVRLEAEYINKFYFDFS
ncbi:MAG: S8 family peptidase [bacterium]